MQTSCRGSADLELQVTFSRCRLSFPGTELRPHREGWPPEPLVQCRVVEEGGPNKEPEGPRDSRATVLSQGEHEYNLDKMRGSD